MITMLKSAEVPFLSSITADPKSAKVSPLIELSPAGKIICECLKKLPDNYPTIRILRYIAMPDHIHFEIFVTEKTEMPLGLIVAAFKSACTKRYREQYPQSALAIKGIPMFQDGFNDKIAFRAGARDAFYNYIADNPRRYLIKKLYPDYFFHKLQVTVNGRKCGLFGNIFLLDHPVKSFVKISRIKSRTPDLEAKIKMWEETIRCGGVLVSPFVNPEEKIYRDQAIANCCGIILIVDYCFSDRKKPYKELFDLCSEGRLLIVSTEQFPEPTKSMNYLHAQELNAIASNIAQLAPGAAQITRRQPVITVTPL